MCRAAAAIIVPAGCRPGVRHRPCCFNRPGAGRRRGWVAAARETREGRAGRFGSGRTQVYASRANKNARTHGPRRLATSRLVEADRAASPPVPRRPARGVCRFAPHRPRWTYLSGDRASPLELAGRLSTAVGPGRRCVSVTAAHGAITGPVDARKGAPGRCGLDRRAASPHLQRSVISRPPLPAPRLETLIRHPFRWGGMARNIIWN